MTKKLSMFSILLLEDSGFLSRFKVDIDWLSRAQSHAVSLLSARRHGIWEARITDLERDLEELSMKLWGLGNPYQSQKQDYGLAKPS